MIAKPTASYDAEADAIGIYFVPEGAQYAGSEEVAPGLVLDFDTDGRVIGVELLDVRRLLATGSTAETFEADAVEKPAAE